MTMTQAVVARTNELLAEKKMSKRDLYEVSGLSKGTIGSIYKGLATSVTLNTLEGICKGLGVTMSEFLDSKYFKREKEASGKDSAEVTLA